MSSLQPIDTSLLGHPGVVVRGEIYSPDGNDVLLQDLIEVELPDGDYADVGWYPEHDPQGRYCVTLYDRTLSAKKKFETRDVHAALHELNDWVRESLASTDARGDATLTDSQFNK